MCIRDRELGPSGINVNCIAPGVILTDMNNSYSEETMESLKNEAPLERLGKPEDIAESISVSYTHLDVYKRQVVRLLDFEWFRKGVKIM